MIPYNERLKIEVTVKIVLSDITRPRNTNTAYLLLHVDHSIEGPNNVRWEFQADR